MGIRKGFINSSIIVIIAFFVLFVANCLSLVAFSTTSWAYINNKIINYQGYGLWRICATSGSCSLLDGTRSEWYIKVQACGYFGMLGISISLFLVVLHMFVEWWEKDIELEVAAILCSFIGGSYAAAVTIFKREIAGWLPVSTDLEYGFSLSVAIAAAAVSATAGSVLLIDVIVQAVKGSLSRRTSAAS